jgi:mono/diheme cytochrome c family protein
MSYFHIKSLIALLLMAAGVTAVVSMLTLMGRSERRLGVPVLRAIHRAAGYVFAALLVAAAILGLRYLAVAGDGLPLRGVLHWVAASLLIVVFALKIVIVRFYKQFLKFVPVLGLLVFSLAFVVVVVSAVFFVVAGGTAVGGAVSEGAPEDAGRDGAQVAGDPSRGEELFGRHCGFCHHAESEEAKIGPGLAGLFARATLRSSGKPATAANVRTQLLDPVGTMPSFSGTLSGDDLKDLIAYLTKL